MQHIILCNYKFKQNFNQIGTKNVQVNDRCNPIMIQYAQIF